MPGLVVLLPLPVCSPQGESFLGESFLLDEVLPLLSFEGLVLESVLPLPTLSPQGESFLESVFLLSVGMPLLSTLPVPP